MVNVTGAVDVGLAEGDGEVAIGDHVAPGTRWVFAAYFIGMMVVGTLGNSAIVLTIWRREKLHSVAYAFIVNLAVADLVVCGLLMPIHASMYIRGVIPARSHPLCQVESVVLVVGQSASMISVSMIAVNRYVTIVNVRLQRWFTKTSVVAIITAVWLYVLLLSLLPAILDAALLEPLQHSRYLLCTPSDGMLFALYVLVLFGPLSVTLISYSQIYLFLRRERSRVAPLAIITAAFAVIMTPQNVPPRRDDSRVLRSITAVSLVYTTCTLLHVVLCFVVPAFVDQRHFSSLIVASWCVLLATNWTNFILYLIFNRSFRREFLSTVSRTAASSQCK